MANTPLERLQGELKNIKAEYDLVNRAMARAQASLAEGDVSCSEDELVHLPAARKRIRHAFFVSLMATFEEGVNQTFGEKIGDTPEETFRKKLEKVKVGSLLTNEGIERIMELYKDRSEIAHGRGPVNTSGDPDELSLELMGFVEKLMGHETGEYDLW